MPSMSWFVRNLEFACHMLDKLQVDCSDSVTNLPPAWQEANPSQTYIRRGSTNCSMQLSCYWKGSRRLLCFSHQQPLLVSMLLLRDPARTCRVLPASLPLHDTIILLGRFGQAWLRSRSSEWNSHVVYPFPSVFARNQQKQFPPRRVDAVAKMELPGR